MPVQVDRENSNALPPFWVPAPQQKGAPVTPSTLVYTNTLTNFTQTRRPPSLRCVPGQGHHMLWLSQADLSNSLGACLAPCTFKRCA